MLPFDQDQFFAVFAVYNSKIWPVQIIAYAPGLIAIGALITRCRAKNAVVFTVLSLMWAWNGLVYQLGFFSPINPAAIGFSAMFMVQAVLFAFNAFNSRAVFEIQPGWRSMAGFAFIVYAAIIYELIGVMAGHGMSRGPIFGVAPCPTTIFTIGMLLFLRGRSAIWLALIPVSWALIGSSAALLLGVPEDYALIAGAAALIIAHAAEWAGRQST